MTSTRISLLQEGVYSKTVRRYVYRDMYTIGLLQATLITLLHVYHFNVMRKAIVLLYIPGPCI